MDAQPAAPAQPPATEAAAAVAAAPAPVRSKKGKKRSRAAPASEEYVSVVPVTVLDDPSLPVQVSKPRRAKAIKVSSDRLTISSECGYRSAQSSRGAHAGTWYFEISVTRLGETGHCRLGIGTHKQEVEAPCGYTQASFGVRDIDGAKIHKSLREDYAKGFKEGDVIGVWFHMPEAGRPMEPKTEVVRWKGRLYQTPLEPEEMPKPLAGSAMGVCINGEWQGVAYKDLLEGTYYAAASLFTKPRSIDPDALATVTFNFGPDFAHAPPQPEGFPAAQPMSTLQKPFQPTDGGVTLVKEVSTEPAGPDLGEAAPAAGNP